MTKTYTLEGKTFPEEFRLDIEHGKYTAIVLGEGGGVVWLRYGDFWGPATNDWRFAKAIGSLVRELYKAKTKLDLDPDRGDGRKTHYGAEGKQPWDDMLELSWAAHFAAGSILKYLRRDKRAAHSLESAKVYYGWLYTYAAMETDEEAPFSKTIHQLENTLTDVELRLLRN
jgi:hypothetical protein